jgi:hypothetical protein
MKRAYIVSSQEGADFARRHAGEQHEVGDEVRLELEDGMELAVVAAGWLEHKAKPKGGDK